MLVRSEPVAAAGGDAGVSTIRRDGECGWRRNDWPGRSGAIGVSEGRGELGAGICDGVAEG